MATLLLTSVIIATSTDFHPVNPQFSVLLLLTAVVLLLPSNLDMKHLLVLSGLLLLHIMAAYINYQTSLMAISLISLTLLCIHLIRYKNWINWLILLIFSLLYLLETNSQWMLFFNLVFALYLTLNILKTPEKVKSLNQHENLTEAIEQAKLNERSRIYQNIHDDVGSELLKLIYQLKDENQRRRVKNIMNQLRQAVAQTAHLQTNAEQLLIEICQEAELRLSHAGVLFSKQLDIQVNHNLSQKQPIHIQRMIRELVSNCIKHAQAKTVQMNCEVTENWLKINLIDDGIGMCHENNEGKGLRTLKKRALDEKASIQWLPSKDGGTQVLIGFPMK